MSKRMIKIICIIVLLIIIGLGHKSLAMSVEDLQPQYTNGSGQLKSFGQEMLGIIRNIAAIASVVILAFIGLKFMFGSVEQRAEYKKSLIPLAVGVLIVLGATTITSIVWKIKPDQISNNVEAGHTYTWKLGEDGLLWTCTVCGEQRTSSSKPE